MVKRYVKLLATAVLTGAILTGCGNNGIEQDKDTAAVLDTHGHEHMTSSGDLQEATSSKTTLPSFLEGASEKVTLAYQAAALLPEALQQVPCYCGCGESAGHKNNFNCFIAEIKEDEVIWDDHGTRCGICVDIALMTASMMKEGQAPSDIREAIDEMYGEGYGEPTPL